MCNLKMCSARYLSDGSQKSINPKGKYHDPNRVLKYHFIGGDANKRIHVREGFQKVLDVCGLKLQEVSTDGDIRISFTNTGSWSYVGTDIYRIPKDRATMNFGWQEDTHRVVVHELLHTLNFSHEHLRGINYDWPKVYEHFAKNGWDKATVDRNLRAEIENYDYTDIDKDSIMMYSIDCSLTLDNQNCGYFNTVMSAGDIKRLKEMFPENDIVIEDPQGCLLLLSKIFPFKSTLNRMLERDLVTLANELGIQATVKDRKSSTIDKIWQKLKL